MADTALAVLLLVPGLPIILFLMLIVRLTSRGPAIYRQERVGLRGKTYEMYKIRTMRADAENGTGPAWSQDGDPRMTRVGRLIRRLHLDELPQLVNVCQGHMSLVGPRPERPAFVVLLSDRIPDYPQRLAIKPGITGLAQINLPPDKTLDCVRKKIQLDAEYIETANLWLDLRVIAHSSLRLLMIPNNTLSRLLKLERTVKSTDFEQPTHANGYQTLDRVG